MPLAQTAGNHQVVYEAARIATIEGWWTWATIVVGMVALLALSMWFYRRDAAGLSKPVRVSLMTLRLIAIAALVVFFLDISRRTRREVDRPSEVAILVDTSQSMSLPMSAEIGSIPRIQRVQQMLGESGLATRLSEQHLTSLYAIGDTGAADLVSTFEIESARSIEGEPSLDDDSSKVEFPALPLVAVVGILLIAAGLIAAFGSLVVGLIESRRGNRIATPWWIAVATSTLPLGVLIYGAAASIAPGQAFLVGVDASETEALINDGDEKSPPAIDTLSDSDLRNSITASSGQSRIGDAIRNVLGGHDPSTLAGIVVVTDGQNNGGVNLASAAASARRSEVMVVPVGMGTDKMPTNVRVVDVDAPVRVYPGDKFVVTAVLQASGTQSISVDVQLLDELEKPAGQQDASSDRSLPGELLETKRVALKADSQLSTIKFEVQPEQVGRRRLAVRVVAPASDQNDQDDSRDSRYEVIARQLKVLAVAGGPTREYRFVRNLLFRDQSVQLDVFLQTGQDGISQDADNLLDAIPSTAQALFDYDAIVMFDPDWTSIKMSTVELMDRYVSQQAGGMILIAGPVFHDQWIRRRTDPRVPLISGFFPVTFSTGSPIATGGRAGGDQAWPLALTDEAARADFMDIVNDPEQSIIAWQDFDGVYDYVSVKAVKPAAKVYAYFSDPTTEIGGSLPVFLASQFYGAGRVVFAASGEMWRLRGAEESYFDAFYTKLVRWVAQSRLQRDGNRGVLLVDNSRAMVGDTITVRAILVDEAFEPLTDPEVTLKVLAPGGEIEDLILRPIPGDVRAGTYGNRYVVRRGGDYEFRVTVGDALGEEVLRQNVSVRLPTIELERPRRNDPELISLAKATGGEYLPVDESVSDKSIIDNLIQRIQPQPQQTILPGTPDNDFARRRNAALLWLIATVLTMEWIVRRLHRLA